VRKGDVLCIVDTHEQVLQEFVALIVHHERIEDVFAAAIGNYGYILRHPELEPLIAAANAIHEPV
jgi:hypothetical protein